MNSNDLDFLRSLSTLVYSLSAFGRKHFLLSKDAISSEDSKCRSPDMLLLTLIFALISLCNGTEHDHPHGITLAPRAVSTSILTITLEPPTDQSLPNDLSITATGAQIELVTDIAELNGDAVLAFGPDAMNNLDLVYQQDCPDGLNSPNCSSSLQAAISVDQAVLRKRVVPVLIGTVAAVLAIEVAWIKHDEAQESSMSRYRMPSPNLAKLSAVQGSKTVVFATSSGGNLITEVPSPTPTGLFTILSVTADSNTAQEGDYIFGMPKSPGFEYIRSCERMASAIS